MTAAESGTGAVGSALAEALTARSMSLVELQGQLRDRGHDISLSALSRWRTGARQPDPVRSAGIIDAMEQVLDTPRGALLGRLPGRSRRIGAVAMIDSALAAERIGHMLDVLWASPYENFRLLSVHLQINIDAYGVFRSVLSTLTLQCIKDTVTSIGFIFPEPGDGTTIPEYEILGGGQRPRNLSDRDAQLHAFAMDLDRPLSSGETAVVQLDTRFPHVVDGRNTFEMVVHRSVREVVQLYRFDPHNVPEWAEEIDDSSGRTRMVSIPLDGQQSIHRIRSDFGPGKLTMRWGWD